MRRWNAQTERSPLTSQGDDRHLVIPSAPTPVILYSLVVIPISLPFAVGRSIKDGAQHRFGGLVRSKENAAANADPHCARADAGEKTGGAPLSVDPLDGIHGTVVCHTFGILAEHQPSLDNIERGRDRCSKASLADLVWAQYGALPRLKSCLYGFENNLF